jgi:hypothetical protein
MQKLGHKLYLERCMATRRAPAVPALSLRACIEVVTSGRGLIRLADVHPTRLLDALRRLVGNSVFAPFTPPTAS